MSGSILLSEVNIDRVKQFQSDNVSKYNALVLETLTTLDFQMVTDSFEVLWSDGEPIIFNEDDGSALFKLSPEGLTCFLSNTSKLAEDQPKSQQKLQPLSNSMEMTIFLNSLHSNPYAGKRSAPLI